MLMYEHIAKEKPTSVQVGIISTREVNRNHANYLLPGLIFNERDFLPYKRLLSERLNRLFCEIFDPATPFTQTNEVETCKYCDFLHICGRQTFTESRL